MIPLCYPLVAMSAPRAPANTFVLRFWLERSISGARWRGSIEHVPSGTHSEFLRAEEMLEFFRSFQIVLEDSHSRTGGESE